MLYFQPSKLEIIQERFYFSKLGLGYGTAISPERTIMDDFLTKYLNGPIKEVNFGWIIDPWTVRSEQINGRPIWEHSKELIFI